MSKILNSKYIRSEAGEKLSRFEIVLNFLFGLNKQEKRYYFFEINVEDRDSLQVGDSVLMSNGVRLIATQKTDSSSIVLRTKQLHYEVPFLGTELIVIFRSFNKGNKIYNQR